MNYRRMVPNSISGLSMVLGVLSIYLSMDGEFSRAAIFIILAVLADSCDGRAARLLGVSGEFGKEMDSICDVCSFGMAPAVLIYTYGLTDLGLWGQIISSLFTFGADCAWLVSMSTRALFLGILKGCRRRLVPASL